MKTLPLALLTLLGSGTGLFLLLAAVLTAQADPLLSSWYTERSGVYARVFQNDAAIPNGATTTWVHPSFGDGGSQTTPTYAGVHELSHTDDWLYLLSLKHLSEPPRPLYN